MAVYEALLLNTVVPQIQAAQAGDSYVMVVNATTPALRITQTGTGNALEVEDSSNPDATPFVVTAAGDVGIGLSSPTVKLDVVGTIKATAAGASVIAVEGSAQGYGIVQLQATSAGGKNWSLVSNATGSPLGAAGSLSFRDSSAGTTYMTLDASGNLGLGVTPSASAGAKAINIGSIGYVFGDGAVYKYNSGITNNAYVNGNGTFAAIQSRSAGVLEIDENVFKWRQASTGTANNTLSLTQAMTLDASGNLVVGAPSTSVKFEVNVAGTASYSSSSAPTPNILLATNGSANSRYTSIGIGSRGTAGQNQTNYISSIPEATDGYSSMTFSTYGNYAVAERARITSGGDLLVGTQNTIVWNTTNEGVAISGVAIQASRSNDISLLLNRIGSDGNIQLFAREGLTVGTISVTTTATAYNTSSDYRLKDNPQPLTGSGAFIDALKPKTWSWKDDGSKGVGFIAHEVQEVSPGTVVGTKDAVDADGKPVMQAMEYGSAEFIANIIAELQSLRARVAQLEAK